MAGSDLPRGAASALLLTAFAADHGLDAQECLRGTGLVPSVVASGQAEMSSWQELQILRTISSFLGPDPGLGLRLGLRYHLAGNGLAGLGLLCAPDFRTGLGYAMRYRELFAVLCHVSVGPGADPLALMVDAGRLPADLRELVLRRDIGALVNAVQDAGVPRRRGVRVEFAGPEPDDARSVEAALGVRVSFGAVQTRLVFPDSIVDFPLPQACAATFAYCARESDRLVRERADRSGATGAVRALLRAQPGRRAGVDQVAAELLTTARTLRRRLADEGTSFRALVNAARAELAKELLADRRLSVREVADRLGYSEPAAFNHAFAQWTGRSPSRYREG